MLAPRTVLAVAGIAIGLAGMLVAVFEYGALRQPRSEDPALDREVSSQRAPSPAKRTAVPRPALPPPALPEPVPANAAPAVRPSARAETKLVLTQIKAQKYVEEAYPAWLRAHPGKDCPRQLIELNEYMDDEDANDAWGRPMKMQCDAALPSGAKRFKVISYGRDGERSEDDIKFGP